MRIISKDKAQRKRKRYIRKQLRELRKRINKAIIFNQDYSITFYLDLILDKKYLLTHIGSLVYNEILAAGYFADYNPETHVLTIHTKERGET